MARVYWILALVGVFVPLAAFLPWLRINGMDLPGFTAALFVNRVSAFFALDVIASAIVLTVFIIVQGARDHVRHRWIAIVATFTIGVSCGLPLFLAMRERARDAR